MEMILAFIRFYTYLVIADVIISWIRLPEDNSIVSLLHTFTGPPLNLIRRLMPDTGGLDFSPIVLIVLLNLLSAGIFRVFG